MSEALLSKDCLIELAGRRDADKFAFLGPIRFYLRQIKDPKCSTCNKQVKYKGLPDDLYKTVLKSKTFTLESDDLMGFLQVDRLIVPGTVTQA